MIDSVLIMMAVGGLVGSPYLLTITIVFLSLAFIAFVSWKMKDVILRVMTFFTSFKTEVTSIRDEVKIIRADQIISNRNREDMSNKLNELSDRMDTFSVKGKAMYADLEALKEFHKRYCEDNSTCGVCDEDSQHKT